MSPVWAIARREVAERAFLFVAAVVASLVALALGHAPGLPDVRAVGEDLGLVVAVAFPLATALAVGASIVARDVGEGRLSFYFARPLSAAAVWAGKFLGGTALVLAALAFCALPVQFAYAFEPGTIGLAVLALLAVMSLAHLVATMYRSRSRLLALDAGLGVLAVGLLAVLVRRLFLAGAWGALLAALPVALAAITVAVLAASAVQFVHGRADVQRGHAALSATLWSLAVVGLGGLALWSGWILGVAPGDLGIGGMPIVVPSRGHVVLFHPNSWRGRLGYSPFFLMDLEHGTYTALRGGDVDLPAFDSEGRTAVWVERPPRWILPVEPRLAMARFGGGRPVIEHRPLDCSEQWTTALALDTGRRRVVVSSRASIGVVDLDAGVLLSRAAAAGVEAAEPRPDGTVRLYARETNGASASAFLVTDWSPEAGTRVDRVRLSTDYPYPFLVARGPDLAVVWLGPRGEAVVDVARGTSWTLDAPSGVSPGALVLSSGTVALGLRGEVRLVRRSGETVAAIAVDPRERVVSFAEPFPGVLAIGLVTRSFENRGTVLVDTATRSMRREEKDLLPAGMRYGFAAGVPEPGSLASRLFVSSRGALIALEPDGRRRQIVSPRD